MRNLQIRGPSFPSTHDFRNCTVVHGFRLCTNCTNCGSRTPLKQEGGSGISFRVEVVLLKQRGRGGR